MDTDPQKPGSNLQKSNPKQQDLKIKGYRLAVEFGFIVAIPLALFGSIGKYLDHKRGTTYFLAIGLVLALLTTTIFIYRKIREIMDDMKN